MLESQIIAIGSQAMTAPEPMLIMFNETASDQLTKVAVIQRFKSSQQENYTLEVGHKIRIDDQEYTINYIGELVKNNLLMLGHATLHFKEVPSNPLGNTIYLEPNELPEIKVGTIIKYY
ncbi:PTS glucitol/sorbitol transporter subunit IIA [Ligilactobacillus ceti]|uniref:PTS system, glucitol sorbitol-specific IIA component n=1 Tax=Ligilactobacillus ceti DSM 22408 TaxID=1122146 RepID=A0A0R2KQA0_9LACO|nr:PTS glucitol/sorbitol transporter subunit IIA [Ligilactobacillus ceti]KRN89068.1 hypothetical protein IV53_GL001041 [Ligilactobacillus ceti DSM 22408]